MEKEVMAVTMWVGLAKGDPRQAGTELNYPDYQRVIGRFDLERTHVQCKHCGGMVVAKERLVNREMVEFLDAEINWGRVTHVIISDTHMRVEHD